MWATFTTRATEHDVNCAMFRGDYLWTSGHIQTRINLLPDPMLTLVVNVAYMGESRARQPVTAEVAQVIQSEH